MTKQRIDPDHPDFDENPEWTETDFANARPAREVLPELFAPETAREMLKPKRGRPKSDSPKERITIRVDHEVVEAFRRTGPGWQTRMNNVLKRHLDEA